MKSWAQMLIGWFMSFLMVALDFTYNMSLKLRDDVKNFFFPTCINED